jgi:hypothetical protein
MNRTEAQLIRAGSKVICNLIDPDTDGSKIQAAFPSWLRRGKIYTVYQGPKTPFIVCEDGVNERLTSFIHHYLTLHSSPEPVVRPSLPEFVILSGVIKHEQ